MYCEDCGQELRDDDTCANGCDSSSVASACSCAEDAKPTCIKDPRSHFDWLVKFIEDVKQDSMKRDGLIYEAVVEVCSTILEHADTIRNAGATKGQRYE